MTRRSKRELERSLEELDTEAADGHPPLEVLYKDERTGELLDDHDGEPTDHDPDAQTIVLNSIVVMDRERAETEGFEILGPAENVPDGRDAVRVAWEAGR